MVLIKSVHTKKYKSLFRCIVVKGTQSIVPHALAFELYDIAKCHPDKTKEVNISLRVLKAKFPETLSYITIEKPLMIPESSREAKQLNQ